MLLLLSLEWAEGPPRPSTWWTLVQTRPAFRPVLRQGLPDEPALTHPDPLSPGELVHARVVGVVHEVVHGIAAEIAGAGVECCVALEDVVPGELPRSVGHQVVERTTAPLERVVQVQPVPDLMGRCVAL